MFRLDRLLLLILCAGIAVIGCDSLTRPNPNTPDALAATSILDPQMDQQALLLTHVANPLPDSENAALVQDATVRIGGVRLDNRPAADSLRTGNDLLAQANYRTDTLDVQPGSTYTLTVEKGDDSLSGTVAVPDTFRGWAEGRRLVWTPSEGAVRYQVHIEDAADTSFEFNREYTVTDTALRVEEVERENETPPENYYVEITAQDPHLVTFMRGETDRAGIKGGYGLFGAQLRIIGTVTLSDGSTAPGRSEAGSGDGRASLRLMK